MDDLKRYIAKRKKEDPQFAKDFEKGFEKFKKEIKRAIKYTDGPIGKIKIVENFLPLPEKLIFKRKSVKVTMALDAESVDFFKKIAQRNHVPYQTMIRNLINIYVAKHQTN